MIEFILALFSLLIATFGATFLVSLFGGHRDMHSIIMVSILIFLFNVILSALSLPSPIPFGLSCIFSIVIFVKFFDFEPKSALVAGFLFSGFFSLISVIIAGIFMSF